MCAKFNKRKSKHRSLCTWSLFHGLVTSRMLIKPDKNGQKQRKKDRKNKWHKETWNNVNTAEIKKCSLFFAIQSIFNSRLIFHSRLSFFFSMLTIPMLWFAQFAHNSKCERCISIMYNFQTGTAQWREVPKSKGENEESATVFWWAREREPSERKDAK